jgi:hypothetical protein
MPCRGARTDTKIKSCEEKKKLKKHDHPSIASNEERRKKKKKKTSTKQSKQTNKKERDHEATQPGTPDRPSGVLPDTPERTQTRSRSPSRHVWASPPNARGHDVAAYCDDAAERPAVTSSKKNRARWVILIVLGFSVFFFVFFFLVNFSPF